MKRTSMALLMAAIAAASVRSQQWEEEVNLAIDRGVSSLLDLQNPDGSFKAQGQTALARDFPMGVTAFALYTLLKSGLPKDDPAVNRAVSYLRYRKLEKIYGASAFVLALSELREPALEKRIVEAARWIERNVDKTHDVWAYPTGITDMSNTQFAALALFAAERRHGYRADKHLWIDLIKEVVERQNDDGGWGYRSATHPDGRPETSGTMTTAGITVLKVASEALARYRIHEKTRREAQEAIDRAWVWLDRCFTALGNPVGPQGVVLDRYPSPHQAYYRHYYYLYGIERITALCRRSRIAGRSWYREGAVDLLGSEGSAGGWGSLANTCLALLFLKRATFTGLSARTDTPVESGRYWRFTTKAPDGGWASPDFDDREWRRGWGAFAAGAVKGPVVRSGWTGGKDIWIRRRFERRSDDDATFKLYCAFDDTAEIYLNGVLAAKLTAWTHEYVDVPIRPEALASLQRGVNVLAAHANDIGGAKLLDVRLASDGLDLATLNPVEPVFRWWKEKPRPEVPFIESWLVLGPLPDARDSLLMSPVLPDEEAAPRAGDRARNQTWRDVRTFGGRLSFEEVTRSKDRCLFCAFTWLDVSQKTEALLWLGADDGLRVLLDGRVILSQHDDQSTPADYFRVPLRLGEGRHRLLVKVDDHVGASHLYARITDYRGAPHPAIRPIIEKSLHGQARTAAAHPSLFSLAELLASLPTDAGPRIDFARADDLERLAIGPSRIGYPVWRGRQRRNKYAGRYQPHPGASGLVFLWPPSRTVSTRLYRKVRLPRARHTFEVRVSPEVHDKPGETGARVRLGVFDGQELAWLTEATLQSPDRPTSRGWRRLAATIEGRADRDVLLVVDVSAAGELKNEGVFIDDLLLR